MPDGPTYQFGDMWTQWNVPGTAFLITTNGYIAKSGELVMGRGIAEQLRDRDRRWAKFFGAYVEWSKVGQPNTPYGCLVWESKSLKERFGSYRIPMCWVGIFQVKHHFRDLAAPDLIEHSVSMLRYVAGQHPDRVFNLNYPGIGFGRLTEAVVEPLLRPLPSNVHVWRFGYQGPVRQVAEQAEEEQ